MTAPKVRKAQNKREEIETWLTDHDVEFTYRGEYPIENVDFEESLKNQARMFTPLNKEIVELYAESLSKGDIFPATVGYEKRGMLIFVDGNHRGSAYVEAGEPTLPVYVLSSKTPRSKVIQLTYEANARHGLPNSVEERIEHAMFLVRSGVNQNMAANMMNVKERDVTGSWRRSEANRRAQALGVKKMLWESISMSGRLRLASIKNDNVFVKAADITHRLTLNATEIGELVTEINAMRTAAGQSKLLDEYLENNAGRVDEPKNKSGRRYLITMNSKALFKIFSREDLYDNMPPQEAEEYVETLTRLKGEIDGVLVELNNVIEA